MRQLELFRGDASVGVLPPSSPLVTFVKRYRDLIVGVGLPILNLALLMMARKSPATNGSAALISLNFACIVFTLNAHIQLRLLNVLSQHMSMFSDINKTNEIQMRLMEVLHQKALAEIAKITAERPNTAMGPTATPLDSQHD